MWNSCTSVILLINRKNEMRQEREHVDGSKQEEIKKSRRPNNRSRPVDRSKLHRYGREKNIQQITAPPMISKRSAQSIATK